MTSGNFVGVEGVRKDASTPALHCDAIVVGAGLGGLLTAVQLVQHQKRVVLLERLPHCGGRFTAKEFQGAKISTGAVHMIPFGSSGVLSQTLRRLHIPYQFFDADLFGSFVVNGKHYSASGLLGVLPVLGVRQAFQLLRLGYLLLCRPLSAQERALPFSVWLQRHLDIKRNRRVVAFFTSVARFALSVELEQVSVGEVIAVTKNMFKFGPPAIVKGGCGEVTHQLEHYLRQQQADVRLSCEVLEILQEQGHVTGVRVRNKSTKAEYSLTAPLVISDIGIRATTALLAGRRITQADVLRSTADADKLLPERAAQDVSIREAIGLKVHVLSDVSLVSHRGIMYCLDTNRIAGIVQPTNSDSSLAPPGKHLLITHQVMRSTNIEEERALALADLHYLFGEAFARHCRVLTMGTYRGEWPVNRIVQGDDGGATTEVPGLYLVGDAVKPSGYLMVEGVAQSVNTLFDLLPEERERQHHVYTARTHTVVPTSRLNPILWLWKAPGNAGKAYVQKKGQ